MKEGGLFNITPYDLDIMSEEYREINNIIALAKADDDVKRLLLIEILSNFKDELEDISDEITDEKLENIITIVEENLDYEGHAQSKD